MAASTMLSRSFVKAVAGLPALGAAKVKTSSISPFLATRFTQAERRRLVVSAKQDTPLPGTKREPEKKDDPAASSSAGTGALP